MQIIIREEVTLMPPKARVTRDMIVEAGFAIAREQGIEQVNARTVSERLGCSTQPVMYHFKRIEDMKRAVYQRTDEFHTAYITEVREEQPLLGMGLNYIRFAKEEKHLFRLLFQTNGFAGKSLAELIEAPELAPVMEAMGGEQGKETFRLLFLFVHGYASMLANNDLDDDEEAIAADLRRVFAGVTRRMKEEEP